MLNPDLQAVVQDRHRVSEANFWPETRAGLAFPPRVHILDSTLRKTYFTAGHATTPGGFVRIAEALVDLGIEDTCLNVTWAGSPRPTPQDWALMTTVLGAGLPLRVNVWSEVLLGNGRDPGPVDPGDALRLLVDAGARYVAPGIVPAPDADAEKRQMEQLAEHVELARSLGVVTTVTLAQAGLRDFDALVRTSKVAVSLGVARLDLMDSTSSMSPDAMRQFITRYRAALESDVPVTMHAHEEFGLATAAAISAAAAGAHPDVSLNGMSYRAGFAALEEVVLALEVLYGVDTGLRLDQLAHASRVVAEESGLPVPPLKPLTGSYAHLKHMPGDAAAAIRTGQDAFPPVSHGIVPAVMGAQVTWVWGGASSDDETRALAGSTGASLAPDELATVRGALDAAVAAKPGYPRWLEPAEARAVLARTLAQTRGQRGDTGGARDELSAAIADAGLVDALLSALEVAPWDDLPAAPDIAAALASVVGGLSTGRLVDLLETFGSLGVPATGARPERSRTEESALLASPDADQAALAAAAARYQRRFGFKPVVNAGGLLAAGIAALLDDALARDAADELARSRAAVCAIFASRLAARNPGGRG